MAHLLRKTATSSNLLMKSSALLLGFFCWSKLITLQRREPIKRTPLHSAHKNFFSPDMVHYTLLPIKKDAIQDIQISGNQDYEPELS